MKFHLDGILEPPVWEQQHWEMGKLGITIRKVGKNHRIPFIQSQALPENGAAPLRGQNLAKYPEIPQPQPGGIAVDETSSLKIPVKSHP